MYDALDVKLTEVGESFYNPYIPSNIAKLQVPMLVFLSIQHILSPQSINTPYRYNTSYQRILSINTLSIHITDAPYQYIPSNIAKLQVVSFNQSNKQSILSAPPSYPRPKQLFSQLFNLPYCFLNCFPSTLPLPIYCTSLLPNCCNDSRRQDWWRRTRGC